MRLFTLLLCSFLVNIGGWDTADAHLTKTAQACFKLKGGKLVSSSLLPNGLLLEKYDTDGDGKDDFATLSHVNETRLGKNGKVEVRHNKMPVFYMKRFEGKVFIDKVGAGKCSDIVLYHDDNVPHDQELKPTNGGREI